MKNPARLLSGAILAGLVVLVAGCQRPASAPAPFGLTAEYRTDPVGIDAARPRLSWKLPDGFTAQTAYEIAADGWNSGRIPSSQSVNVEWNGGSFASGQRVAWKVRVWDADGKTSAWSAPARFTMGVLRPADWKAKWIGANAVTRPDEDMAGAQWITGTKDAKGVAVLRRTFEFAGAKPGEFVEIVHTGLPQQEITVNGKSFNLHSGHLWRPEFVRFRDMTPWLTNGTNTIEVKLLKDKTGTVDDSLYAFLAKIVFPGGRTIVTDASWEGAKVLGGVRDLPIGKKLVLRQETASPAFARTFTVSKPVKAATLHVTGVGFYEASLNGRKIGDKVLDPSPTDFDDHVLYSTYLVEDALRPGENTLQVLVGHGWYDVRSIATWNFENAPWRDFPRMLAQLDVEYADGTRETIASDRTWRQVASPVAYDCIREGEVVAPGRQKVPDGLTAEEVPAPKGTLVAEGHPGAKVMRELKPETVKALGNGAYMVKFPENFAGWVRLTLRGQQKGDVAVIRYDERANSDLKPAASSVMDGLHARRAVDTRQHAAGDETRRIDCHFRYTASQRTCSVGSEFQADRFISSGAAEEVYEPRFTYNGFQYVYLRGLRQAPRPEDVVGCVVHTAFADIGTFDSSDATLNTLVKMAERAYKSNFADGCPTDCPHREKNGWTGDASIACELAQYLFENTAAYEKWLRDVCDTQIASGDICCIAPTSGWGFQWGNGPAWDSALPVIAWTLYCYRDDRRVLDAVYPALVRYLAYTATKANADGLVKHGLGDWIPVIREHMPSTELTSSCYYYQAQKIAAKIAALKGRTDDARRFASGAEKTRRGINAKFYKGDGVYDNAGQTAQAMPIAFGVVEPSERTRTAERLAEAVMKTDCHVDMGLLGTKHVFRTLSRVGRTDLAFRMLVNPTRPSPAEWIQKGGTTLWEDWNNGASRNHIMFGDFAGWAYQYLAGIRLPETDASCSAIPDVSARGFREVVFAPCAIEALDHVSASVDTPYGVYSSAWSRADGKVSYTFAVPAGGAAVIRLPGRADEKVGPGVYRR